MAEILIKGQDKNGGKVIALFTGDDLNVTTGGAAKEQMTPTIGGTNTSSVTLSPGSGGSPSHDTTIKLLVTVNTMDDVEAGTVLTNEYPDVFSVHPGETVEFPSPNTAITRVSCIAIITSALGSGNYVGTKLAASAEAVVAVSLRTFTFLQSDDVRLINVGLTDNGTEADGQIYVEGWKNA